MCVVWEVFCNLPLRGINRTLSDFYWSLGKLAIFSLLYLSPFRADPNRATEGFQKTPMEIALERVYYFDVFMLLAGTVNGDTPSSTKLRILSEIMELYRVDKIYPEVFKKNLDDLSVQEVHESTSSSDFIQLSIDSIPQNFESNGFPSM